MCAAKQFAVNQCAINQYVYQYKEWQCVWNQQVVKQDAAEPSVAQLDASNPYVAQQYAQRQHAADKYCQRHHAADKSASEQGAVDHCATQQPACNHHHSEEQYHLTHSAVQQFSITHDAVEQYDEDVCDFNQFTIEQYHEEEYDFNQYAVQQYLVEQFPRGCYAGDESDEENVINPFMTEQYVFSPYCVEQCREEDCEFNRAAEPCDPSQYVERHLSTAYHQSAEEQYALNQNASDHYGVNQYTEQWYTSKQYEEEQHFVHNYAAEWYEKEEQYQNAARRFAEKPLEAQQFAEGHYAINHYTSEQYILDHSDPLQAAAGQHSENLIAFPHAEQFVAVRYAPNQYAVDQYFSDLYAAAEHYVPQQCHVDQYPESAYVVDPYSVKQHAGAQYKGDVCPFSQCASGKYVCSQYETQHYVTEHDAAKLQAAVQYEAQQQALKYYGLEQHAPEQYAVNHFEAEQCGLEHYLPEQYVLDHQQSALSQYATEQYAPNQFKAEQHDLNHYLAEQYGINHQQNGLNQNPAEKYRMGRKALGLYKTKQSVTNHSRTKRCNLNQRMSEIGSTVQYPAQRDATTQKEEKRKATEHDTDQDSTELSAAKHDCKGIETVDLNAAMQGVAQQNSARSEVVEQDLDDGEDKVPRLDAPEMARPCATNKQEAERSAELQSERKEAGVQEPPVDSTEKDEESLEATDCKVSGKSTKPSNPDVAEWDDCSDATEVIAAELISPEQKRGVTNTAEEDAAVQDATQLNTTELRTAGQDAPHQTAMQPNALEWDIARQASSGYDLVEPDAAEQDCAEQHAGLQNSNELCRVQQETFMPVAAERDTTKQRSTGSDTPKQDTQTVTDAVQNDPEQDFAVKGPAVQIATETVEAKQSVTEQHGTILDARGHNSTQLDASDWGATKQGSTVKEHTGSDDGDWDAIGQIVPERCSIGQTATECEATTQVTAEQEPTDHNPGAGDANVPMMFPAEEDCAERYCRRGTRSCRTGCSRALFSKGQSSKARYYSRSHYSTRCCND